MNPTESSAVHAKRVRSAPVERALAVVAPVLISTGAVLSRFAESATTPESLLRPIAVSGGLAAATFLVANAAVRNRAWAAILSTGLVLFTFRFPLPAFAVLAFSIWWLLISELRRRQRQPKPSPAAPEFVARGLGLFGAAFLLASAAAAVSTVTSVPRMSIPEYAVEGEGGPNIYVIMLDGYPREDTLLETFGFDNSEFLEELRHLDLDVSSDARANYNKTWPALAAMFNGKYADEMLPDGDVPREPLHQLR